jgi:hypothetical protein
MSHDVSGGGCEGEGRFGISAVSARRPELRHRSGVAGCGARQPNLGYTDVPKGGENHANSHYLRGFDGADDLGERGRGPSQPRKRLVAGLQGLHRRGAPDEQFGLLRGHSRRAGGAGRAAVLDSEQPFGPCPTLTNLVPSGVTRARKGDAHERHVGASALRNMERAPRT